MGSYRAINCCVHTKRDLKLCVWFSLGCVYIAGVIRGSSFCLESATLAYVYVRFVDS